MLNELAVDYATGKITRGEWDAARAAIVRATKAIPQRVSKQGSELHSARWHEVIERVVVAPAGRGAKGFRPDRFTITWRQ